MTVATTAFNAASKVSAYALGDLQGSKIANARESSARMKSSRYSESNDALSQVLDIVS